MKNSETRLKRRFKIPALFTADEALNSMMVHESSDSDNEEVSSQQYHMVSDYSSSGSDALHIDSPDNGPEPEFV